MRAEIDSIKTCSVVNIQDAQAGSLNTFLKQKRYDLNCIEELVIIGSLNDEDLQLMRDSMPVLRSIDLSQVYLPDNRLSDKVFMNKETLCTVKLPESLRSIGWLTFVGCKSLETIDFTKCPHLEVIGKLSFSGCGLKGKIILPDSVSTIEDYAFYGNKELKEIDLSNNLQKMGELIFKDCSQLEIIRNKQIVPLNLNSDIGIRNIRLLVPYQSLKNYKKAKIWKDCNIESL